MNCPGRCNCPAPAGDIFVERTAAIPQFCRTIRPSSPPDRRSGRSQSETTPGMVVASGYSDIAADRARFGIVTSVFSPNGFERRTLFFPDLRSLYRAVSEEAFLNAARAQRTLARISRAWDR